MSAVGYGAVGYSVASGPQTVWLLSPLFFLQGIANATGYLNALHCTIANFSPDDRGKVVGLIASAMGISATIVSLIYRGLSSGSTRLPASAPLSLPRCCR